MDGSRFDAWTRRRCGVAGGWLLAMPLAIGLEHDGAARKKEKKRKKRCGKHKRRCQGQCIKRSQCCSDGECAAETSCCRGECVALDNPCGGGPYVCFAEGKLRRSVEGDVYCTRNSDFPACVQCESSEGCLQDERCFYARCAEDVDAVCRKVYVDF